MNSEDQFNQLARRDNELHALASRGRWRSLVIMILAFVPAPFLVMLTNDDRSLLGVIPVGIACVVATSYSWTKWQRRPEDAQFVAFVGLDRRRQWATYRSMRHGTEIDDPVVLTIIESIHHHLRRSLAVVVATILAIAAIAVALVEAAGNDVSFWVPAARDGGWRSHRRTSLGHQSSRHRHRPQPAALRQAPKLVSVARPRLPMPFGDLSARMGRRALAHRGLICPSSCNPYNPSPVDHVRARAGLGCGVALAQVRTVVCTRSGQLPHRRNHGLPGFVRVPEPGVHHNRRAALSRTFQIQRTTADIECLLNGALSQRPATAASRQRSKKSARRHRR